MANNFCDLLSCGPKIAEHDWVAFRVSAYWVSLKVNVDSTSKCVSDN